MKDLLESNVGKNNIFPLQTNGSLAKRWGVSSQSVINWSKRHNDFPKPIQGYVDENVKGTFFAMCDVEVYEKKRGLNKPLDK